MKLTTFVPGPFKPEDKPAMLLFSGGMDSTVLAAKLKHEGRTVVPIVYNTHTPDFELRRTISITQTLKRLDLLNNTIVADMPSYDAFRYSSDPFGFQPGRKMIYITIALSYMQMLNINELYAGYGKENAVLGFKDEEKWAQESIIDVFHDIYGNEHNDFSEGNRVKGGLKVKPTITCPFRDMLKEEVVNIAVELGVEDLLQYTSSCNNLTNAGLTHCGTCIPCLRKKQAYDRSNMSYDPTHYTDNVSYKEHMDKLPET